MARSDDDMAHFLALLRWSQSAGVKEECREAFAHRRAMRALEDERSPRDEEAEWGWTPPPDDFAGDDRSIWAWWNNLLGEMLPPADHLAPTNIGGKRALRMLATRNAAARRVAALDAKTCALRKEGRERRKRGGRKCEKFKRPGPACSRQPVRGPRPVPRVVERERGLKSLPREDLRMQLFHAFVLPNPTSEVWDSEIESALERVLVFPHGKCLIQEALLWLDRQPEAVRREARVHLAALLTQLAMVLPWIGGPRSRRFDGKWNIRSFLHEVGFFMDPWWWHRIRDGALTLPYLDPSWEGPEVYWVVFGEEGALWFSGHTRARDARREALHAWQAGRGEMIPEFPRSYRCDDARQWTRSDPRLAYHAITRGLAHVR